MVSLSTLFQVSPSGYSASFTSLSALVWKSSKLMEPWRSFQFHNSNQSIGFWRNMFLKEGEIPVDLVSVCLCDLAFNFPLVHQLHARPA